MHITTLAARNVYRNGHRSLVTTVAMAFACAMMIVFAALIEGFIVGSEKNIVTMNTGDIQIHQPGYRDDPDIYKQIDDSAALAETIRQAGYPATERIYAFGLMAGEHGSAGVQLHGFDLKHEADVSQIHRHIMRGKWLDINAPNGVVIGKKLARLLDVSIGSELIFVGQTADGYMANDRFQVRGILKSVSALLDNGGVIMIDSTLRNLISLPDNAHEIVILRPERNADLSATTMTIKQLSPTNLEILNWRQLMPIINRFLETAKVQTFIMLIFTYIAVASVILNAMLMNVFERIHEFGIMKAIGVSPWQLIRLVYAETLIQTVLASLLGGSAGCAYAWYLQHHGLDMSSLANEISFAGMALDPVWYAYLSPQSIYQPIAFLFIIAVIAVIYPAIKVAILRPIDAIQHQ